MDSATISDWPGRPDQTGALAEHYSQGLLMYRQGRYAQAIEQLQELGQADGLIGRLGRFYLAMSHRGLGIAALSDSDFSSAERHLLAAAETVGHNADLAGYLARLYAGLGRSDRCAEQMEKVVEAHPLDATCRKRLAIAQWRQGNRPLAYMTLTQAIRDCGGDCLLHVQLGLFHAAEEQFAEAQAELTRAVQADCTDADAHYYLALVLAAQGNRADTVRSLQRAFELRPSDTMLAYQLALAARSAGQAGLPVFVQLPEPVVDSAGSQIRQLARYVCQEPDFIDAFTELPRSPVDTELFGLLAGVLQCAVDEHPGYADLHYHTSRVLARLERVEAALESVGRALEINPRYVKALTHAAGLHCESDRDDLAVESLERAISSGGDWADVHCMAGRLMGKLKRSDGARAHLRRALEINGTYTPAAEALRAIAA